MRRFPVTTFILIAVALAAVGGWMLFAKAEHDRYVAVQRVLHSRSEFHLTYSVEHADGPLERETWTMNNVDGKSSAAYAAVDRKGTIARFDEPITGYEVTFLFDKLVQDGIWELHTRAARGKVPDVHAVTIEQVSGAASGQHHFEFTDPHYLATTAGRQYEIHLDPKKPVPDLLMLQSTSVADPRYQKIVDDFEGFGGPNFKQTVVAAREKLLRS
jgi:hypothetical protein